MANLDGRGFISLAPDLIREQIIRLIVRGGTFDRQRSGGKLSDYIRGYVLTDKNSSLSEEKLRLLIDSMSSELGNGDQTSSQVTNMLVRETVKFRNKLKEETGEILTVGDTRTALDALGSHLEGREFPQELTPEQKALTQIWIDRLTLFGAE